MKNYTVVIMEMEKVKESAGSGEHEPPEENVSGKQVLLPRKSLVRALSSQNYSYPSIFQM